MADQFVGEIRAVGFSFAPVGWALCNGQLMPISQNTALFSLLGTYYGGDGRSTFALPNLQGSMPIGQGQGPGLSDRFIGESGGAATVSLVSSEIPVHTHVLQASAAAGSSATPNGNLWAVPGAARGLTMYDPAAGTSPTMAPNALSPTGGSQPHNNLPPYLVVNYIIALQGIFPSRA